MKIYWNAPVTLTLTFCSLGALVFLYVTGGLPVFLLAGGDLSISINYLTGALLYPLAHQGAGHYFSNFALMLLLAPTLEERYGSGWLLGWFAATTILIAIVHAFLSDGFLIGASGLVFFCIMLSSMAGIRGGQIPVTMILVGFLYLGKELVALGQPDQVSQLAHLLGGLCGIVAGQSAGEKPSA